MINQKRCYSEDCKNPIFVFRIDKDKVTDFISDFLDPLLEAKQFQKLLEFKSYPEFRNSIYCKKCLDLKYEWFIFVYKNLGEDMLYKKFSDLYIQVAHDFYINELYSSIFEGKDNLRRSIFEKITSQLNISEEKLDKDNPEFAWFLIREKYNSVLVYWQKNFILKEYIGQGQKQGKLNGPDFIFEDKRIKKTYGFEIFGFNNNFVRVNKPVKDFERERNNQRNCIFLIKSGIKVNH